jgi:hypothetical protein
MILVLVFVGSALVTAGALYFIDIRFCKDAVQAIVALIGGLVLVAGGEVAVTGSSAAFYKTQQAQTSACEMQGEAAHPDERRHDANKTIFHHIVGCMSAAGYDWTDSHEHCREAPVATNPLCYLPRDLVGRAITRAQVMFE